MRYGSPFEKMLDEMYAAWSQGRSVLTRHSLAGTEGLGPQHYLSGLTVGHVLRASAGDDAAFAQLQYSDLGGVPGGHNLLSVSHGDTTPAAAVRGDIVTAQGASPVWARLAKGTQNYVLKMGADESAWGQVSHTELGGVTSDQHHTQLHGATHQDTGADEINVTSLSGLLADPQTPLAHLLVSAYHTAAGLTLGDVLTATGATTFAFQAPAGGGFLPIHPGAAGYMLHTPDATTFAWTTAPRIADTGSFGFLSDTYLDRTAAGRLRLIGNQFIMGTDGGGIQTLTLFSGTVGKYAYLQSSTAGAFDFRGVGAARLKFYSDASYLHFATGAAQHFYLDLGGTINIRDVDNASANVLTIATPSGTIAPAVNNAANLGTSGPLYFNNAYITQLNLSATVYANSAGSDFDVVGNVDASLKIKEAGNDLIPSDTATVCMIMMFKGLVANIPAGWLLCDGLGNSPDLRAKFVRGAPAGSGSGGTGGADTHALSTAELASHSHSVTVDAGGGHTHTGTAASAGSHGHAGSAAASADHSHTYVGGASGPGIYAGGTDGGPATNQTTGLGGTHTHTITADPAGAHTHTLSVDAAAAHTHTASGGSAGSGTAHQNMPAYYEVLFIYKD